MISRQEAVDWIMTSGGRFVSLVFTKRSDGSEREMLCRLHVKKHLTGGGSAYNFADKGLIPVWDRHAEEYRVIPTEGITRVMIRGEWQEVE